MGWTLNHGNALVLIYGATVVVWLTGAIAPLIELPRWVYLEHLGLPPLLRVVDVQGGVMLFAFAISTVATIIGGHWARMSEKSNSRGLRRLAVEAMQHAVDWELNAESAARDTHFLNLCVRLAGQSPNDTNLARMRRRAEFHTAPAHATRFLPQGSDQQLSAHLIASLCDLPPRWILDSVTGRRA